MWKNVSCGPPISLWSKEILGRESLLHFSCVWERAGGGVDEEVPRRVLHRQGTSAGGECSKHRQATPGEVSELTQIWDKIHEGWENLGGAEGVCDLVSGVGAWMLMEWLMVPTSKLSIAHMTRIYTWNENQPQNLNQPFVSKFHLDLKTANSPNQNRLHLCL